MVNFLDGPAGGVKLALRRIPILLRVVRAGRRWDALDQLDDEPEPRETIFVYRRADDVPIRKYFICSRGRGKRESGLYWEASYRVLPEQPADDQVRSTEAWQTWAAEQLVVPLAKK